MKTRAGILFFALLLATTAHSRCVVRNSAGQGAAPQGDYLFQILTNSENCPPNVQALRALLEKDSLKLRPAMVANRGIHNSAEGSFSFFERVVGKSQSRGFELGPSDFFFGHFTQADNGKLALAQSEGLMIELIVWDPVKGAYNFYELIGQGNQRQWFYRGDSFDIFEDNRALHLQKNPARPEFGQRLRCSGCHASGGPIMKELSEPQNDWWRTNRRLPLFSLVPEADVENIMRELEDASVLARAVRNGIDRLELSPSVRNIKSGKILMPSGRRYTLREALRPLFATVEINLESDLVPGDLANGADLILPSASLRDPRLATAELKVPRSFYEAELQLRGFRFPEINRMDADHGWLTPVKSYSDKIAIDQLMNDGIIEQRMVSAILVVDPERPLFSALRQSLLAFVPEVAAADWQTKFVSRMKEVAETGDAISSQAAKSFLHNYLEKTPEQLRQESAAALEKIQSRLNTADGVQAGVERLVKDRQSVLDSEISKNPRGQILEPGFRVIFPQPDDSISLVQGCVATLL